MISRQKVLSLFYKVHVFLFAKVYFSKFNRLLFQLGLRGLGILNYENLKISGEESFLKKHISKLKTGVIFDVGANIGDFTIAIKEVNPMAAVYAFEPQPNNFKFLLENLKGTDVKLVNVAVGKIEGIFKLYDYNHTNGQMSAHASMIEGVIETIHKANPVVHEVKVVTIDMFISKNNIINIDLLKIDVEGNELDVLRGAKDAISQKKIKMILFEFNEMNVLSRSFFSDFIKILPGYKFYRMLPNGLLPLDNYNPLEYELFAFQNIVAFPEN